MTQPPDNSVSTCNMLTFFHEQLYILIHVDFSTRTEFNHPVQLAAFKHTIKVCPRYDTSALKGLQFVLPIRKYDHFQYKWYDVHFQILHHL